MENRNILQSRNKPRTKENEDCTVEIKKTKYGKKIIIGKNCNREQIQMIKDNEKFDINEVD